MGASAMLESSTICCCLCSFCTLALKPDVVATRSAFQAVLLPSAWIKWPELHVRTEICRRECQDTSPPAPLSPRLVACRSGMKATKGVGSPKWSRQLAVLGIWVGGGRPQNACARFGLYLGDLGSLAPHEHDRMFAPGKSVHDLVQVCGH